MKSIDSSSFSLETITVHIYKCRGQVCHGRRDFMPADDIPFFIYHTYMFAIWSPPEFMIFSCILLLFVYNILADLDEKLSKRSKYKTVCIFTKPHQERLSVLIADPVAEIGTSFQGGHHTIVHSLGNN